MARQTSTTPRSAAGLTNISAPPDLVSVSGVEAFAERYDLFLVDQWGVLHDGRAPFPGVVACLHKLAAMDKRVVILSNSGKRADANIDRLSDLGIDRSCYTALITSGEVARVCLASRRDPFPPALGRRCLLWSSDADTSLVDGLDLEVVSTADRADFILLAGAEDGKPMADYQTVLQRAAARGIPLICANPDMVRFSPRGFLFSAGAVARRYEEQGGTVHYIGKPYPAIYQYCRTVIAPIDPSRTVAVGDSFIHDITGGAKAGMQTAFVTGGIHRDEFAGVRNEQQLAEVIRALSGDSGVRPNWVIPRFQWQAPKSASADTFAS